jgi:hypothetical protein
MTTATISRGLRGYEARTTPAKEGLRMSDVAQRMWKPMTAMGVMVIAAGLVLGIVSATHANDYFGLSAGVIAAPPRSSAIARSTRRSPTGSCRRCCSSASGCCCRA